MDRRNKQTTIRTDKSGSSIPVYRNVFWSRNVESDNYSKRNDSNKHNRHNKYIQSVSRIVTGALIVSSLFSQKVLAETVGGVSATASPIANSSGSVTNQAIQVLQGPYITNTYGGGIQCQGPTLNFTPFVTGALSRQRPYEDYYMDPVYDMRDMDDDGAPDNPGDILYRIPIRTGQKDNHNRSMGISATLSIPLDGGLQARCKKAADTHTALQKQILANKRLDFEIARLKNCGELIKAGIMFHPDSQYAKICADVVVRDKTYITPHRHTITSPSVSAPSSKSESPDSDRAALLGAPLAIKP